MQVFSKIRFNVTINHAFGDYNPKKYAFGGNTTNYRKTSETKSRPPIPNSGWEAAPYAYKKALLPDYWTF